MRDETLAKEQMAHLFIMKAVRGAPLWLQVGLGRYLQKFRIHYKKRLLAGLLRRQRLRRTDPRRQPAAGAR